MKKKKLKRQNAEGKKNRGVNLPVLGLGKDFLDMTTKTQKRKLCKSGLCQKLKCVLRATLRKCKDNQQT